MKSLYFAGGVARPITVVLRTGTGVLFSGTLSGVTLTGVGTTAIGKTSGVPAPGLPSGKKKSGRSSSVALYGLDSGNDGGGVAGGVPKSSPPVFTVPAVTGASRAGGNSTCSGTVAFTRAIGPSRFVAGFSPKLCFIRLVVFVWRFGGKPQHQNYTIA